MLEFKFFEQQSAVRQFFEHQFVGVFDENAFHVVHFVGHAAVSAHQLHERQVVFSAHVGVVLAERRRYVDYARAVCKSNVAVACDVKRLVVLYIVKQRHVFGVFVFPALFDADFFVRTFLEVGGNQRVGKDVIFVAHLDFRVILVRIHTKRHV